MRKTMYTWIIFLLAASLFSCQQKSNPTFEDGAFTVTNEAQHIDVSFTRSTDNANYLEALDPANEEKLLKVLNSEYAHNKLAYTKLIDFHISEGTQKSYLIFQAYSQDAQQTSAFAYEIKLNGNKTKAAFVMRKAIGEANGQVAIAASDSHSCTGSPCSCCSFTKDSNGNITGCKCDQVLLVGASCYGSSGTCNHSMSTGGQPRFAQCGGIGWTGPTTCAAPYTCSKINDWYFQCQ